MKLIVRICILFSLIQPAVAQRQCGSAAYARTAIAARGGGNDTGVERDTGTNEVITIPVVIHVLYNSAEQNISDAQILSQLKILNEDFRMQNADRYLTPEPFKKFAADTRINFCLARVAPGLYETTGIIRRHTDRSFFQMNDDMKSSKSGGDDAWDTKQYLNIWVCKIFNRGLGYATSPGTTANMDGVVIAFDVFGNTGYVRAPYNKGRTATHEIGHWLGLKHTWGDDDCGNDDIDDTPSQQSYNYNCPAFPRVTSCSPNAYGDMFMNFMDFTDDACMNMFTAGQKNKMRSNFALHGFRNTFLNAGTCDSSYAINGPLPADTVLKEVPVVKNIITIYPNPATSQLNIQIKNPQELSGKIASLFTASGQPVKQQVLVSGNDKIQLGQLQPGIYILRIGDRSEKRFFKVVKL